MYDVRRWTGLGCERRVFGCLGVYQLISGTELRGFEIDIHGNSAIISPSEVHSK